jgi:glycosyltransferase involved in cell wall biosynthesis
MAGSRRVLHVLNTSEEGGGARHLFQLVSRLDPLVFAPVVATTDHGPLVDRLQASNVRVVDVDMMRGRVDPRPVVRLRLLLRGGGFDLVHLHGTRAGFFGALALAGVEARPRVIYTVHCLSCSRQAPAPVRRFYAGVEKFIAGRADRAIFVSERDRRSGVAGGLFSPDRTVSIPNGIDVASFPASMPEPFSRSGRAEIVTIARLVRQKGIRFLVEAARRVVERHGAARFTVFGDGPERRRLEAQAAELGLGERLRFAGLTTDVVSDLGAADLFVLPSLWEGMPISLLEAMAAGRSVIATAVSGSTELVIEGETGRLVPPGDARALAAAIDGLLRDRAAARAMAAAGRARVRENFSVERMLRSTADVYRELLGTAPGRG